MANPYRDPMPPGRGNMPAPAKPNITVIPYAEIPAGQGTAAPGAAGSAPPPALPGPDAADNIY